MQRINTMNICGKIGRFFITTLWLGVITNAAENLDLKPNKVSHAKGFEFGWFKTPLSFLEAKDSCEARGWTLAKLDTDWKVEAVQYMAGGGAWIGGTDSETESVWRWLDGTKIDLSSGYWYSGEPNNANGNENCIEIFFSATAELLFNDINCETNLSFVCQRVARPTRISYIQGSEFGYYETFLSHDDATDACKARGSVLAKLDTIEKLNSTRKDSSGRFSGYWIGGDSRDMNDTWMWQDGSLIDENDKFWGSGEPSSSNEKCLSTKPYSGEAKWNDWQCHFHSYFICERTLPIVVEYKEHEFTLFTMDEDGSDLKMTYEEAKEKCATLNSRIAEIRSKRIDDVIKANFATLFEEDHLFWIGGRKNESGIWHWNSGPQIHYERLNSKAPGKNCAAIAYDEWHAEGCMDKHYFICEKAPPYPDIISITPHKCNSNLVLNWTPSKFYSGSEHRITVKDIFSKVVLDVMVNSNKTTKLLHLPLSSTRYKVFILPCKNSTKKSCIRKYKATHETITWGIPNEAQSATMKASSSGSSCRISWSPPDITPREVIQKYEITANATIIKTSRGNTYKVETNVFNSSKEDFKFSIPIFPNRNYSIVISAMSCAGSGRPVTAVGQCISNVAAPFTLSTPKLTDGRNSRGKVAIEIEVPDERNGPISCLFVIVSYSQSDSNSSDYSLQQLKDINQLTLNDEGSMDYIAMAVDSKSLLKDKASLKLMLGDEKRTNCDVYGIESSRRRRSPDYKHLSSFYVGHNRKIKQNTTYDFYIVSATPFNSRILLRKSIAAFHLDSDNNAKDTSVLTIGLSTGAGILLLIIFVGVFIFIWRRRMVYKKNSPLYGEMEQAKYTATENGKESDTSNAVQRYDIPVQ